MITEGYGAQWLLPEISPGSQELKEVKVEPADLTLVPIVSYESGSVVLMESPLTS